MKRPLMLDLFCGAGGAAVGYHRAGFDVIGVDHKYQKRYPYDFIQDDALKYLEFHGPGDDFDIIHASPPCQYHSYLKQLHKDRNQFQETHQNLIPETRQLLLASGKPYIIENVPGAKHNLINPLMLCGTMFGLKTDYGNPLLRHRYFETMPLIWFPPHPCQHDKEFSAIGVHGGGQHPARRTRANGGGLKQIDDDFGIEQRRIAMGIDWMTTHELNQAIPPAYTEYIGKQMMKLLFSSETAVPDLQPATRNLQPPKENQ